jgi:hypothetical protein
MRTQFQVARSEIEIYLCLVQPSNSECEHPDHGDESGYINSISIITGQYHGVCSVSLSNCTKPRLKTVPYCKKDRGCQKIGASVGSWIQPLTQRSLTLSDHRIPLRILFLVRE